jgi:uncharacterized membrane protein YhiD involved in acid resistance
VLIGDLTMTGIDQLLAFSDSGGMLTLEALLMRLLAALVLSQAVAWVYIGAHRGISYSTSVAQAILVMALIVTPVMAVVGNSIARAFGLFGALALIRFRTPVKDARDTVFLFLSVALGIACGTGNILAGLVGTIVISTVLFRLCADRFGTQIGHDGLLRFSLPAESEEDLQATLSKYCERANLLHVREAAGGALEYAYEITLDDPGRGRELLADVQALRGATSVSLLMQDSEAKP